MRLMRQEGSIEGVLKARMQQEEGGKEKKWKENKGRGKRSMESLAKDVDSACKECGKQNHPYFRYWRRPDVKC
ncbi:Retrovirus-related Pol polyprotein from transposon TNT 1-94 [Cucumis melo var. makuwa]|uniref:Retrovirus-related Pol polyprotein from transposon TNT 1-94 n=1 Tax=Cucumis melo var. makuwa TaxID=1194695 RepID=A0A5A7TT62_CUCMM|nr:Retrovirus-related Pol polyprotein from transposon TNT 1-94 [Cucumis melo var. makuwa]TYK18954.1 Retrovirus-related Pol polyprotein from transposon TNT 1-94 [Cucumis melo var. makuwa]